VDKAWVARNVPTDINVRCVVLAVVLESANTTIFDTTAESAVENQSAFTGGDKNAVLNVVECVSANTTTYAIDAKSAKVHQFAHMINDAISAPSAGTLSVKCVRSG
jgi:hypothetical protein